VLPSLDILSPAKLEFFTEKDLFVDHYLQCMQCKYIDKGLDLMRENSECSKCGEMGSRRYFPANNRILFVYNDLVETYYELHKTKSQNERKAFDFISNSYPNTPEDQLMKMIDRITKTNVFQFEREFSEIEETDKVSLMNLHLQLGKILELPHLQYSYIIVHSLTLLEMYLSYLIQSILIRKKTNIKVVMHTVDTIRSFEGYFKSLKNLSKITWKKDIHLYLFKNLSHRFDNIVKLRNNFVHHGRFIQNLDSSSKCNIV